MPCDQRRTVSVQWTENTDIQLLADALRELGYSVQEHEDGTLTFTNGYRESGRFANSTFTLSQRYGGAFDEARVKTAYGRAAVNKAAKINRWPITWTSETEFEVVRQ